MLDLLRWRKLFLVWLLIIIVKSDIFAFVTIFFIAVFIVTNWHLMLILAWYSSLVMSAVIVNVVLLLVSVVVVLELLLV